MKKKRCIKCGKLKQLEKFYKHSRMADGRLNACAECCKAANQANYRANFFTIRRYDKLRQQRPERRRANNSYSRKHKQQHPDRKRARNALNNAVRDGRLVRKPCERCGTTRKVEGHHADYSKPLVVHWLCRGCHHLEHGHLAHAVAF